MVDNIEEILTVAREDSLLKRVLIERFGTDVLASPSKSDLIAKTYEVFEWILQVARPRYSEKPERLKAIIVCSAKANAMAVWSGTEHDWIVVSEELIESLVKSANRAGAHFLKKMRVLVKERLMQRVQEVPRVPMLRSGVASFFYFAGISFFVGHEAAHHIKGHDGFYVAGAHAEISDDTAPENDLLAEEKQALEFDADTYGAALAMAAMLNWAVKFLDVNDLEAAEIPGHKFVLATLLQTGLLMGFFRIQPKAVEWGETAGASHPPAVLRMINLSNKLTSAIKTHFKELPPERHALIRIATLILITKETFSSKSTEGRAFEEKVKADGDLAALEAVGIIAALEDANTEPYLIRMQKTLANMHSKLRPRTLAVEKS